LSDLVRKTGQFDIERTEGSPLRIRIRQKPNAEERGRRGRSRSSAKSPAAE